MLNREVYLGALKLLAEPEDPERTADYADRTPYILAQFISENAAVDAYYREAHGLERQEGGSLDYAALDSPFPLCERFVPAARFYLSSMLIDSEDADRADHLFDRYCQAMTAVLSEIPAMRDKIMNAYNL